MGLFDSVSDAVGGLFGGGDEVDAPELPTFEQAQAQLGINIKQDFSALEQEARNIRQRVSPLQLDLLERFGETPTLDAESQEELNNASRVFSQFLENARINSLNQTNRSIQGLSNQFGLGNIDPNSSGALQFASGVTAQNQANLNQVASQQAGNLLQMRQNLLSNIYNRFSTQFNASSNLRSQSQNIFGTLLNAVNSERGVQAQQAQLDFQADLANQQSQSNMFNTITGGLTSLASSAIRGGLF